jgi:hypothetical protein
MTPETIRAQGMPRKDSIGDLKWGGILIAVALARVVFGWTMQAVSDEDGVFHVFLGMSSFPGFIGVVLLGFGLLGNNNKD